MLIHANQCYCNANPRYCNANPRYCNANPRYFTGEYPYQMARERFLMVPLSNICPIDGGSAHPVGVDTKLNYRSNM